MKKLIVITAFLLVTTFGFAQSYSTGIGLRGGFASGITAKHFITEENALEGILSTRWNGFMITGLYEIQNIAFDTPGLYWYYGFGGHIGFWDGDVDHRWFDENKSYTVLGIDGVIGLEYAFAEVPFSVSLDWKPAVNIIGFSSFWGDSGGLSVRYIF